MTTEQSGSLTEQLREELMRLRATDIGRRMTAIEVLLGSGNAVELAVPADREPAPPRPSQGRRGPGVSQAKLAAVRAYMEAHGEARQVDIANDLDENSGSVSLALRALEADGTVEDTGRVEQKSKVWRFIGAPSAANGGDPAPRRATVIEPGDGMRRGRLAR